MKISYRSSFTIVRNESFIAFLEAFRFGTINLAFQLESSQLNPCFQKPINQLQKNPIGFRTQSLFAVELTSEDFRGRGRQQQQGEQKAAM